MNVVDLGLERTRYAVIDETIESRWRRVTSMQHDAVAVVTPRDRITFAELELRADALARDLRVRGSHGMCPVAVDVQPTAQSVVQILATLISGRALVMIDPELPDARRAHIMATSGATALQSILDETAATGYRFDSALETTSTDTAMITFTSGTSGTPKGVTLSHSMCLNKSDELAAAIDLRPDDHIGNLLPVSFGAGITALIMGLMNGVTVFSWDPRIDGVSNLDQWMATHAITTAHCAPSFLRAWTAVTSSSADSSSADQDKRLRVLVTYGEAIHGDDYARHRSCGFSEVTYVNWMATTETGVIAYNAFPPQSSFPQGIVPAGRARDGKDVQVVDSHGIPLPDGEIGEIQVVSRDLADGYWGDPKRTSERFTKLGDGISIYRTGDRGRIDEHGELQLRGRLDDAVKIRGYLVEPSEVENCIRRIPDILECVAVVHTDNDDPMLCAYVVCDPNRMALSPAEIRRALAAELPGWMVPRHIVPLASLPRNERGKVDRTALPLPGAPTPNPVLDTITEFRLGEIWTRILGVEAIDRNDNFFELGGDSLGAAEMLVAVKAEIYVSVAGAQFAAAPTIRELADTVDSMLVSNKRNQRRASVLVPLSTEGTGTPLFIVTGAGAPASSFSPMVNSMSKTRPVYALQQHGMESRGIPDRSVTAMARRYIRHIRTVRPQGPYALAGYSHGGYVALEIARRLRRSGEIVEQVVVLDTRLRENMTPPSDNDTDTDTDTDTEIPTAVKTSDSEINVRARPTKKSLFGIWLRYQVAGLVQFDPSTQWYLFYYRGLASLRNYRPKPYDGAVTVIRGHANNQDSHAWSNILTGAVNFTDVKGRHEDIIRVPYVSATGRALENALTTVLPTATAAVRRSMRV